MRKTIKPDFIRNVIATILPTFVAVIAMWLLAGLLTGRFQTAEQVAGEFMFILLLHIALIVWSAGKGELEATDRYLYGPSMWRGQEVAVPLAGARLRRGGIPHLYSLDWIEGRNGVRVRVNVNAYRDGELEFFLSSLGVQVDGPG